MIHPPNDAGGVQMDSRGYLRLASGMLSFLAKLTVIG